MSHHAPLTLVQNVVVGFVALLVLFWIPRDWWWLPPVVVFATILVIARSDGVKLTPLRTVAAAVGSIAITMVARLMR